MSRLIDADKLEEAIREYFKSHVTDSSCMVDGVECNADIHRIVEEMARDFRDCNKSNYCANCGQRFIWKEGREEAR